MLCAFVTSERTVFSSRINKAISKYKIMSFENNEKISRIVLWTETDVSS